MRRITIPGQISQTLKVWLVFLLVFIPMVSPRIDLGGLPGSARISDVLFPAILALLLILMSVKRRPKSSGKRAHWALFWGLLVFAGGLFGLFMISNQETIRAGFTFRYLLVFVAALVGWILFEGGSPRLVGAMASGLITGTGANVAWVVFQFFSETKAPFWSFTSKAIAIYGASLIGEPAVFGAGQLLTVGFATTLAALLSFGKLAPRRTIVLLTLGVGTLFALWVVDSRTSIVSAGVAVILASGLALQWRQVKSRTVMLIAIPTIVMAVTLTIYLVNPRLRVEGILSGLEDRIYESVFPYLEHLLRNPIWGLGPGGGRAFDGGEAHNMYVLIATDFGLAGLALFLGASLYLLSDIARLLHRGNHEQVFLTTLMLLLTMSLLFSGIAQDAILPVGSSQLMAFCLGAYMSERYHFQYERERPSPHNRS